MRVLAGLESHEHRARSILSVRTCPSSPWRNSEAEEGPGAVEGEAEAGEEDEKAANKVL